MIKALGGNVVFIGMTDDNLAMMRQNNPIMFNLSQLGLESLWVAIAINEDGKAGFPSDFEGICFAFTEHALQEMRSKVHHFENVGGGHDIAFFVVPDMEEGERIMRCMIDENTVVKREGFPPTQFVSDN